MRYVGQDLERAGHGAMLGAVIRRWRVTRGWSQRGLGVLSSVSQSTISRLESGRLTTTTLGTLGRLAWALHAEEAVLLALAPEGEDLIREAARLGGGPSAQEICRALRSKARPRHDQAVPDEEPWPIGRPIQLVR